MTLKNWGWNTKKGFILITFEEVTWVNSFKYNMMISCTAF